jgi:hypothetical protein
MPVVLDDPQWCLYRPDGFHFCYAPPVAVLVRVGDLHSTQVCAEHIAAGQAAIRGRTEVQPLGHRAKRMVRYFALLLVLTACESRDSQSAKCRVIVKYQPDELAACLVSRYDREPDAARRAASIWRETLRETERLVAAKALEDQRLFPWRNLATQLARARTRRDSLQARLTFRSMMGPDSAEAWKATADSLSREQARLDSIEQPRR